MSRIITDAVESVEAMGHVFEILITIAAVIVIAIVAAIRMSK
jgi:hypothetical protein